MRCACWSTHRRSTDIAPVTDDATDERFMRLAMANASTVRLTTRPNPWVGSVVVTDGGDVFQGATSEPGGPHAEIHALRARRKRGQGATLYSTPSPARIRAHRPCVDAIIEAVCGASSSASRIRHPGCRSRYRALRDRHRSRERVLANDVARQLAPYLTHRRTGRPQSC